VTATDALIGREAECALVYRLLDEARKGRSGSLVLLGEPGIGKSALLDYAVASAGRGRVRHPVRRAR
jgi:predicted ATPase